MYFKNFPKIDYPYFDENKNSLTKSAVDITRRIAVSNFLKKNKSSLVKYTIRDEQRSDTLANTLYENSELHWVFYIVNEMINPYFSWPMSLKNLQRHVSEKYSGSSIFTPSLWKNTTEIRVSSGYKMKDISPEDILFSEPEDEEGENELIFKKNFPLPIPTLQSLIAGQEVVVFGSGGKRFFPTKIKAVRPDFYEIQVEEGDWWGSLSLFSTNYLLYELNQFGINYIVRLPITRFIGSTQSSVKYFTYRGNIVDPQQDFNQLVNDDEDSIKRPYLFFHLPGAASTANYLYLGDSGITSFADIFASSSTNNEEESLMSPDFYVTNYDYELELNESKREIIVPSPEAVEELVKRMKEILGE